MMSAIKNIQGELNYLTWSPQMAEVNNQNNDFGPLLPSLNLLWGSFAVLLFVLKCSFQREGVDVGFKIKRLHNLEHCCPFGHLVKNNNKTDTDDVDKYGDKYDLLTHNDEVIMMLYFIRDTRSLFRIISCSSKYFD